MFVFQQGDKNIPAAANVQEASFLHAYAISFDIILSLQLFLSHQYFLLHTSG
jgi:hypothetical protein